MLVQPGHRIALPRFAMVGAESTPPRSISVQPSRMASWIARQRRRCMTPGWVSRTPGGSPEWTVDSRPPWRYRRAHRASGSGRRRPAPRGRRAGRPRARRSTSRGRPGAARTGSQAARRCPRGASRSCRSPRRTIGQAPRTAGARPTSRPCRGARRSTPSRSAPRDPLAGALGEPGADRGVVRIARQRQAHPMARRLDLRDRAESGRP